MSVIKCSLGVLRAPNFKAISLLPQSVSLCVFIYLLHLQILHLLHHRLKALIWGCWLLLALVGFKLCRPWLLQLSVLSRGIPRHGPRQMFHGRQIMCWLMISYTVRKNKKNLPWCDKIFMMYLEQIPSCICLCNLNVEQSEEGGIKEAGALCCTLQRCQRQMLAISKLQWGRCQLLNCAEEWKMQSENIVWYFCVCVLKGFSADT